MATGTLTGPQVTRRRQRQNEWARSLIGDILALLVGLGSCYSFTLIGDIHLSEIILIPSLALLLAVHSNRLQLRKRRLGIIVVLLLAWLFSQVITDIYRLTPLKDWIRGQANILFFLMDLIGLAILLKGNMRRQMVFLFGLAIGVTLSAKLQPGLYQGEADALKFAYCWSILYLVAVASSYFYGQGRYAIVGLLMIGDIGFNILFNFRTIVLTMFVSACLVLPIIPERIGRVRILPPARTRARVLVTVGITLIAGTMIGKTMTLLAASGALGHEAQQKNEVQTTAGWGILIGGRPEILVSSRAVIDSPILGHGSWAKDPKYHKMLVDIETEYGIKVPQGSESRYGGLIPAHSHLMSAWVDAGILGGIFWIYILVSTVKSLLKASMSQLPLKPAYISLLVLFLWDIMFSPFGGLRRVTVGFMIVLICDVLDPDSPGRQIIAQTLSRAQIPLHPRNLGRVSPRY
ncbi:hypothetical protein [Terracidiphilus gabretensis]|uniref:hypothetical protein n=1 Tax=Terracidiphilus gabretensis TaxID=1577687 RepID=UPI00071BC1CA|nr:hypothetical protein [Terracidiphilus gabretensis]